MKPIATFQLRPKQTLIASGLVFVIALWPLLTLKFGRPTNWLGDFLFLLCVCLSILTAPVLCFLTFIDMVRRRADSRLLAAFVLSLAAMVAMFILIYSRIYNPAR